jgi:hypothetical protein
MKMTIAAAALTFAVLAAPSAGAQEISGTGPICLSTPSGPSLCTFQTMAQCQSAKLTGSISRCVDRSELEGTVGSGASTGQQTDTHQTGTQQPQH